MQNLTEEQQKEMQSRMETASKEVAEVLKKFEVRLNTKVGIVEGKIVSAPVLEDTKYAPKPQVLETEQKDA